MKDWFRWLWAVRGKLIHPWTTRDSLRASSPIHGKLFRKIHWSQDRGIVRSLNKIWHGLDSNQSPNFTRTPAWTTSITRKQVKFSAQPQPVVSPWSLRSCWRHQLWFFCEIHGWHAPQKFHCLNKLISWLLTPSMIQPCYSQASRIPTNHNLLFSEKHKWLSNFSYEFT